jgi:uncharacterized protein YndB with AHSA1/START domain
VPQEGVYREVAEPERLVMEGPHGVSAVTYTDLGDGRTEMVLHATIQITDEMRGATEAALASSFDRLAEQLASRLESSRHK